MKTVKNVSMPACNCGFRTGYAKAIVDGQPMRLYTSQSSKTDFDQHRREVVAEFEQGKGEPEPPPHMGA